MLCDARFQPSPEKIVVNKEEKDEFEVIDQETRKSLVGQSNLFWF